MMDTLRSEVYTALKTTGVDVSYFHPQAPYSLPAISYYESLNRELDQAEGVEILAEVEYTIDVWDKTPESTASIGMDIDTALSALRLKRTFSYDLYESETKTHHKNMRYRGVIHIPQQLIYQ